MLRLRFEVLELLDVDLALVQEPIEDAELELELFEVHRDAPAQIEPVEQEVCKCVGIHWAHNAVRRSDS